MISSRVEKSNLEAAFIPHHAFPRGYRSFFIHSHNGQHVCKRSMRERSLARRVAVRCCDASLSDTILRALDNEFRGRDFARVRTSFEHVIHGKVMESGEGTPAHQRAASFIEGLESSPFSSDFTADLKWVNHLEANWEVIARELSEVTSQDDLEKKGNNIWAPPVVEAANAYGPDWRTLVLKDRVWDRVNIKLFPRTTEILQNKEVGVPIVEAFFARQAPQTGIELHTDDCNFIMTMHLGLTVPPGQSWIEVGGERKYWENGKALVFNTSYFHRTKNESPDQNRIVLLLRVWHPQLNATERDALRFLFEAIETPNSHPAVLKAAKELRAENKTGPGMTPRRSKTAGRGFSR